MDYGLHFYYEHYSRIKLMETIWNYLHLNIIHLKQLVGKHRRWKRTIVHKPWNQSLFKLVRKPFIFIRIKNIIQKVETEPFLVRVLISWYVNSNLRVSNSHLWSNLAWKHWTFLLKNPISFICWKILGKTKNSTVSDARWNSAQKREKSDNYHESIKTPMACVLHKTYRSEVNSLLCSLT